MLYQRFLSAKFPHLTTPASAYLIAPRRVCWSAALSARPLSMEKRFSLLANCCFASSSPKYEWSFRWTLPDDSQCLICSANGAQTPHTHALVGPLIQKRSSRCANIFCAYADKECEPRQLLIFLIRAPTHKRRPMNEWRRKWHFNQSIAEQSKHDKSRSHIIGPWLVVGNQFTATRSRKDGMSGEVRPRLYQQLITRRKNESVRWARTFQGLPPRDVSLPCLRRVDFFFIFFAASL